MNRFSQQLMLYRLPYGKFLKEDPEALDIMKNAGINLVSISPLNTVNAYGEPYTDYPAVWRWKESYDFSSLDKQIQEVLIHHPEARLFCTIDLNSPLWLARMQKIDSFYNMNQCALNPEWRTLTTAYLKAFLKYAEEKYGDRIIGYVPACGSTLEWIDQHALQADLQKSAEYKAWCLREKYPVLPIPSGEELNRADHDFVRDPQTEAHVIQWQRFCNSLTADLAIHFIRTIRENTKPGKLIGIFYGYIFHLMTEGHQECERVFDTAPPDFVIGAACNSRPSAGCASGYIATLHMLKRRGIGYLHECDRITSTTNLKLNPFIECTGAIWNHWKTPAENVAGVRRELSLALIHQFSIWWFNIWGRSYDNPELKAEFPNLVRVWKQYAPVSTGSSAQILLVHDPESSYHVNFYDHPRQYFLAHELRNEFSRTGLPFDTAAWNDLPHINLKQYRMVIFQNTVLQSPERNAVFAQVCSDSRLIVWIHAPGIIRDGVWDPGNVTRLTGFEFGKTEFAVREFAAYRSVYFAEGVELTDEKLRALAEQAGVHCYTPVGNAVWQSAELLMIHRKGAAEVPISLPQKVKTVKEVFSDRTVARDTDRFTARFTDTGTMLFYIQF